jgi:hypothetical protein
LKKDSLKTKEKLDQDEIRLQQITKALELER